MTPCAFMVRCGRTCVRDHLPEEAMPKCAPAPLRRRLPRLKMRVYAKDRPRGTRRMEVTDAVNIHELRDIARRRLPAAVFDFLEGGCDDEEGLAHNRHALTRYRLVPSYC